MNQSETANDQPAPTPTGLRCPLLGAEAIYAMSIGELDLRKQPQIVSEPLADDTGTVPLAEKPVGDYEPRQPNRRTFDAADIYELSRPAHPWQAAPIEKRPESETPAAGTLVDGDLADGKLEADVQKAG